MLICFQIQVGSVHSNTKLWLLGHPKNDILGCKLPSLHDVLLFFLHHWLTPQLYGDHNLLKETVLRHQLKKCLFWERANIPMSPEQHAITELEKRYGPYLTMKKKNLL